MVNYPIGDFLIKVKNAAMAGKQLVVVEETSLIKEVALVLKKEKILDDIIVKDRSISVKLGFRNKRPVLLGLKLISKPGLRVYINFDKLKDVRGSETYIISTSKGVMLTKEALNKKIGGEVIAKIW